MRHRGRIGTQGNISKNPRTGLAKRALDEAPPTSPLLLVLGRRRYNGPYICSSSLSANSCSQEGVPRMVSASVAIEGAGNDAARPKERALARLWQNADTLSNGLVTEDGKHLRVVYPGRPNARAGPDFRDCVIQTDTGQMVTGDVELHINAPDWVHHNHHVDRNFNGVILHVVLFPKRKNFSTQQSRTVVPIASVAPVVGALERTEESSLSRANWPGNLRKTGLAKLIDRAGDQRFLGRSKGFTLDMEVVDPEEVLYRALLESLGYAANREPFRRLARQVPMATMRSLGNEPDASRLLAITTVLINAAGLMSLVQPPDQAERLSAVLKHLPRTKTMAADA